MHGAVDEQEQEKTDRLKLEPGSGLMWNKKTINKVPCALPQSESVPDYLHFACSISQFHTIAIDIMAGGGVRPEPPFLVEAPLSNSNLEDVLYGVNPSRTHSCRRI